jgi:hypothetical protein
MSQVSGRTGRGPGTQAPSGYSGGVSISSLRNCRPCRRGSIVGRARGQGVLPDTKTLPPPLNLRRCLSRPGSMLLSFELRLRCQGPGGPRSGSGNQLSGTGSSVVRDLGVRDPGQGLNCPGREVRLSGPWGPRSGSKEQLSGTGSSVVRALGGRAPGQRNSCPEPEDPLSLIGGDTLRGRGSAVRDHRSAFRVGNSYPGPEAPLPWIGGAAFRVRGSAVRVRSSSVRDRGSAFWSTES